MDTFTIGQAAARSGWTARMLRYLEDVGLVMPTRTRSGYRLYGTRELDRLRRLAELRVRFGIELSELAFVARLRRDPDLRAAVDAWFAFDRTAHVLPTNAAWVDWEQRKHERLLAA